ncbi:MAG TPA: 3-isopropylmalate dehydrogenase [Vicinamibacterales bacterium]|nr:3-isopropylmalate dehydrogenase [Vicinamibacterales bacterium]
MRVTIAVLPGDGIGPEVIAQAQRVLTLIGETCGHTFEWREWPIGAAAIRQHDVALPDETLEGCLAADAVLLGAVGDPSADHLPRPRRPEAALLVLRQRLGAFANLRPARTYAALIDATPYRPETVAGADLLIVRELLGGLYYGEPRRLTADAAENTMRYTRDEIVRVARVAFEQARHRRGLLTSVDKANVLETSQLWRTTVTDLAHDYPDVRLEHMYVDACAMRLALQPTHFDVIVTENLFGDILSDQAAAVAGSIGMLPSASIGGRIGLYEPVHGSAPDIAGRNCANPLGAIGSVAMLLRHTAGLTREADFVEDAIAAVLDAGLRPQDLARMGRYAASTTEVGEAVVRALEELIDRQHAYHAV